MMTVTGLHSVSRSVRLHGGPTGCLWLLLVVYSFCHAPIPGVNEPHYLSKARHYWDASWGQGDFFLESSNPHRVFYQTVGWLTHVMSFSQAAVVGRVLTLLLLAAGLQRFSRILTGDRWSGVTAGVVFLLLQSTGNLAGEWVVGGVEGKVVAYACALHGLADCAARRWVAAGSWLGLAIAFHPLVGLWTLTALGMTAVTERFARWLDRPAGLTSGNPAPLINSAELKSKTFVVGMVLMICLAAWGVLPALDTMRGASEREIFAATWLQVFVRVKHHVDPMDFPLRNYLLYAALSVTAWLLNRRIPRSSPWTMFHRMVFCAGIIAVCGIAAGYGERPPTKMPYYAQRMKLLKFYPFRLFDVLLPLLVALQVAGLVSRQRLMSVLIPRPVQSGILAGAFSVALMLNAGWGSVHHMNARQEADWRDICEWIRRNTPERSVFLTPNESWAFKWFAQRPEFVARKDCPQDAAGMVEWNRRLNFIRSWAQQNYSPAGYSRAQAMSLSAETGITHILARRFGPFDLPVLYRNRTYRVYGIPQAPFFGSQHQ